MSRVPDEIKNHNSLKKRQFCTFRLSGQLFGLDIRDVKEINSTAEFTPIFHAPREVRGYVNIRGQIHLILDMRCVLGYEPVESDHNSRLILFKPRVADNFGILVDRIGDVVSVDESRIEERNREDIRLSDADEQRLADLTAGVCKLENMLMLMLDSGKLPGVVKTGNLRPVADSQGIHENLKQTVMITADGADG